MNKKSSKNPFKKGDLVKVKNRYYAVVLKIIDRDVLEDQLLCQLLVLAGNNKIPVKYNRQVIYHFMYLNLIQVGLLPDMTRIKEKALAYLINY